MQELEKRTAAPTNVRLKQREKKEKKKGERAKKKRERDTYEYVCA